MLTKKQIWRRTHVRFPRYTRKKCGPDGDKNGVDPSETEDIRIISPPESPIKLKSALSSGNLSGMAKKLRNSRVVRFSATVHVLLIPSRFELLSHCINIYFTSEDYQLFKREAVNEIREVARFYSIPVKQAMNYLYQPDYIIPRESTPDLTDDSNSHSESSSQGSSDTHDISSSTSPSHFDAARSALENDLLRFITRAKTDVELNAQGVQPPGSPGSRRIPTRTTTSAPSRQHQLWAVQWKKQESH